MKNLKFFFLACIATLFACNPADQPMTADEKAQIKADVTETFNKTLEEAMTLDVSTIEKYNLFNEDYSTMMDGVISVGGEKAREMFTGAYAYIDKWLYVDILQLEVIVLDRNTAVAINAFNEAYLTVTGDTVKVKGAGTYVMELVDGKWMTVHLTGVHQPGE